MMNRSITQNQPARSNKQVFIVEDDPTIRDLLVEALTEEIPFLQCIPLSTGQAALRTSILQPPDLLICDYLLGDTTGIEVYDQLRSRMGWEEIPTLFVSATPPWHEIKARHLACLEKPFDLDELLTVVNTLLYCQREPVCVARGGFHATRVDEAIAC